LAQAILFTECNGSPGWGRDAGCYVVASRLRQAGYSVIVIDFFSFYDVDKMQQTIEAFIDTDTLFVGFTSTLFSTFLPKDFRHWMTDASRTERNDAWNSYFPFSAEVMEDFFSRIKTKSPQAKIIVGGHKVAQKRRLQEQHPGVDIWVEGMADVSIVEICRSLEKDRNWVRRRVRSEDDYAHFTDFSRTKLLWNETDIISKDEALPIEISRGCPFRCTFCDYKKKNFGESIKDPNILRDELLENYERFGTTQYMITDFLVNEDLKKMTMLHKIFTELPFKIEWSGFGRLDLLDRWPEMREMIFESGARSIMWGIESVSEKVGKNIRKNCNIEDVTRLLQYCKDLWKDEIIVGSGFIVGLPGETHESATQMMDWLLNSGDLLHGFEVTPLYIGEYNPEKASRIDYSEIQKNPAKFGFDVKMVNVDGRITEQWVHTETGVDKKFCIDLIEQYQAKPEWNRRKLMSTYHHYSRLRNLGFNHTDLLEALPSNSTYIDRAESLYFKKSEKYFDALFGKANA
jgi:radical SAM superfamily enzyme YgiQ (UPF0313 family)